MRDMLKKGFLIKFSYYIAIANNNYLSVMIVSEIFESYSVKDIAFNYSFLRNDLKLDVNCHIITPITIIDIIPPKPDL